MADDNDDILDFTLPANVPGVLFMKMTEALQKRYPKGTMINTEAGSKKRAQHTALELLTLLMEFYEAAEASDDGH